MYGNVMSSITSAQSVKMFYLFIKQWNVFRYQFLFRFKPFVEGEMLISHAGRMCKCSLRARKMWADMETVIQLSSNVFIVIKIENFWLSEKLVLRRTWRVNIIDDASWGYMMMKSNTFQIILSSSDCFLIISDLLFRSSCRQVQNQWTK